MEEAIRELRLCRQTHRSFHFVNALAHIRTAVEQIEKEQREKDLEEHRNFHIELAKTRPKFNLLPDNFDLHKNMCFSYDCRNGFWKPRRQGEYFKFNKKIPERSYFCRFCAIVQLRFLTYEEWDDMFK